MEAVIKTNKGLIVVELFYTDAPVTVANFAKLVNEGFYDGLSYHRVIELFMIQGGCPLGTGTGGPGYNIKCEINSNKHKRGSLAMAHAGVNTGGSQFYITHVPTPHLDRVHTVFGQVTHGLDVVDAIVVGDKIISIVMKDADIKL